MIGRTNAKLLAYVVMPNHLHIVLRQGRSELGAVMQPLLRRVAYSVQRHHGFEGTVVERRYRDRACRTADHVREALMYTHLNPWRAGLCEDDLGYPWMSQRAYRPGTDPVAFGIDPHVQRLVMELFALAPRRSRDQLCADYFKWLDCRMKLDRARRASPDDSSAQPMIPRPNPALGDLAWQLQFPPANPDELFGRDRLLPDLSDYIASQLSRLAPGVTAEDLRGAWPPHRLARCRVRVIQAATERGYRTGELARFFDISPSRISAAKYAPRRESA